MLTGGSSFPGPRVRRLQSPRVRLAFDQPPCHRVAMAGVPGTPPPSQQPLLQDGSQDSGCFKGGVSRPHQCAGLPPAGITCGDQTKCGPRDSSVSAGAVSGLESGGPPQVGAEPSLLTQCQAYLLPPEAPRLPATLTASCLSRWALLATSRPRSASRGFCFLSCL